MQIARRIAPDGVLWLAQRHNTFAIGGANDQSAKIGFHIVLQVLTIIANMSAPLLKSAMQVFILPESNLRTGRSAAPSATVRFPLQTLCRPCITTR
jgi:hypothetical protein